MTSFVEQYGYITALKVGEYETIDNSAEPQRKYFRRRVYSRICNIIQMFNIREGGYHYCVRKVGNGDTILVHRISDGITSIEPPPMSDDPAQAARLETANKSRMRVDRPVEEREVEKVLAREEKRLARPENQLPHQDKRDWLEFQRALQQTLVKAKLLPAEAAGKSWYLVVVGGVPMGPPSETLANAKQTAKLYRQAKVVELREVT